MACSLCRLPFCPIASTTWPAPGMLPDDRVDYMKQVVAIGPHVPGVIAEMVASEDGNFMNKSPSVDGRFMVSICNGKKVIAMHPHCSGLFRYHAGLEFHALETFVELSILDKLIGLPMDGANVGRLPYMNYEVVLEDVEHSIDMNVLWSAGPQARSYKFDWDEWKRLGLQWTATPADTFPRFEPSLTPARLESAQQPVSETSDVLTTLPLDILCLILEHPALPNESFVRLLGTCRTFRTHALTTFQPLARARVIALRWAIPIPIEYASFIQEETYPTLIPDNPTSRARGAELPLAHAEYSPTHGDWLLYLGHVHQLPNMRARRWLWTLATRLAAVRAERRAASEWEEDVGEGGVRMRSKAWNAQAQKVLNADD